MKIEIDDSLIPEGYEPIGYGKPKRGQVFLDPLLGNAVVCSSTMGAINRILLQKKHWKPMHGESYLRVRADGEVVKDTWFNMGIDIKLHSMGNCYQTREEAEQAAERVRKAYLGE